MDTGELATELEPADPLVPVVTGAAVAAEAVVPLVPVVTGATEAAGAVAAAGAVDFAPAPLGGLAPATGLCRTLWIVRWTTWVRIFGCAAADVAAGWLPFELRA